MIFRPNSKKKPVVLICDGAPKGCKERQHFASTDTNAAIQTWAIARGWSSTYVGPGYRDLCPVCARLKVVSESYIKWAVAS